MKLNLSATALRCTILIGLVILISSNIFSQEPSRKFIAHRGVDLKHTIAGENSLEAIWLAKRAGFQAIETDVRLTADDSLVVMHDPTLNRTCLLADGAQIAEPTPIADLSWKELQAKYRLKADNPSNRSKIPSLHQYLNECKKAGLFTFIEPKLVDSTGNYYKRIIRMADGIFGKGNYVVTSNNKANNIIRYINNDKETPLMGILYQTTYPAIQNLGNCIMAISATKFEPAEYATLHRKAHADGLLSESHADKFKHFNMINDSPVDYVSTDFLVPDYHGQGEIVQPGSPSKFGGLYLTFTLEGKADVTLGPEKFTAESTGPKEIRHQVMLYNITPVIDVKPIGDSKVSDIKIRQVEY